MAGPSGPKKSVVIPIELDAAQALRALKQFQDQGEQATKAVAGGMEEAKASTGSLRDEILGAAAQMQALNMGREAIDALTTGMVQAAQMVQEMARRFVDLRDRARELAGVLNQKGDTSFTVAQAKFGYEAGFADPGRAVDFRTAFQGEANQYQDRFRSAAEFAEFEKQAARLGNQYNVAPDVMARLAGTVIRTGAAEGQTSAGNMQVLGGAFKTMMAGSGSINELAGQLARTSGLIGEGKAFKDPTEAAVAMRMAAETNLPEAYTWQNEMRTGVVELATGKKPEERALAARLGITADTTNFEAIRSLSRAQRDDGRNLDVFLAEVFPQMRIRAAFRDAIEAERKGVMDKGLADATSVGPGEIEAGTASFLRDPTQPGRLARERAGTALAEAKFSENRALIEPFIEQARAQTLPQRSGTWGNFLTVMGDTFPFRAFRGSYRGTEALEHWTAYENVRTEAGRAGVDLGSVPRPGPLSTGQIALDQKIAELVRLTEQANRQREAAAAKQAPPAALSAPPPRSGSEAYRP